MATLRPISDLQNEMKQIASSSAAKIKQGWPVDPATVAEMRRRIAMQLMAQKQMQARIAMLAQQQAMQQQSSPPPQTVQPQQQDADIQPADDPLKGLSMQLR